ncbi:MAG: MFS transporter [Actinomycetota bacterium]|nr:MFS transporter [Actinomycetota bacterium]
MKLTNEMVVPASLDEAWAVPIAGALGGWRASLAVFSGVTILLFLAWTALTPPARERPQVTPPRLPWGRRVVWVLVTVFALQSIVYYGLVSWMPDSFQERGWSAEAAGSLVGVMSIAGLPSGLLLPFFADHLGSRRQWLCLTAGALLLATVGIATLPDAGWAWAALAGMGIGATFPLTLTLPLDVAHEPAETGAVVGLMLGAGYTIAAAGPLALGAARDITGSFSASLWVLVVVAAGLVAAILPLSPARLRPPAPLASEVAVR